MFAAHVGGLIALTFRLRAGNATSAKVKNVLDTRRSRAEALVEELPALLEVHCRVPSE